MEPKNINIAGREIGVNQPTYIIAEISANHQHDYNKAVEMIHAAKEMGADAVKIQTYTPDTITLDCNNDYFQIGKGTIWEGQSLYKLYGEAYMPWDWQPKLKEIADNIGITLFSTPFDPTSVEFLELLDVPAYKIASFEIVDISLLELIASKHKPIIMSTGMATLDEIEEAVNTIYATGNKQLILLKCTSSYPAKAEDMNLATISDIRERFGVVVGLSDHTLGIVTAISAVALGAAVIEKHFTLSRADEGPDSQFSLEPEEFKRMVKSVREAEASFGKVNYHASEKEVSSRIFRRSLFIVKDIKRGEEITPENIRSIRPAHGLHTRYFKQIINNYKAKGDIIAGTPLSWDLIEETNSKGE